MKFYSLWLLIPFCTMQPAHSQKTSRVISGMVTSRDEGHSLPGVLVYVKGTQNFSGTQQDGMYYIEVTDKDSVLVFSYNDCRTKEVRLAQSDNYNVVLEYGQASPATSGSPDQVSAATSSSPEPPSPGDLHPPANTTPFSPLGSWRAVFHTRPEVEVPVNFQIRATKGGDPEAWFLNADEQFDGGRVKVTEDSLFIFLDQFDNELAFRIAEGKLTGVLKRQDNTGSAIPVDAVAGITYRFPETGPAPAGNLSGTYDIVFKSADGKEEKAVGLFHQKGNKLKGTFLHVTGDSRYLEGIVQGNEFYLSSFIGSGPSYYKGTFTSNGQLTGEIVGGHGGQGFTGTLNPAAALPDPYKLTWLKEGYHSFDFSLPDAEGHKISLTDKKFKNKVVIVTIGGTWCPNCVDETSFLAPWYDANHKRGIEIVSIQYERQTDPQFVRKVLTRMRDKYHIKYDQVFGGLADKQGVANSLPALNTFLAFPTTILIDKQGRVSRIHTGYTGPATGVYYEQFLKEFNQEIDTLLKGS